MTPNLKDKSALKIILIVFFVLGMAILCVYLSGVFLLLLSRQSPSTASLTTFYEYWYWYGTEKKVQNFLFLSGFISAMICVVPIVLVLRPRRASLYGEARFATDTEIRKAGLNAEKGLIVGKHRGKFLVFGGQEHAIIAAPTRSGKGVGVVIPNLLNWPDSAVILDIKQENWTITAGFRAKHGQKCFLFNPEARDYKTHRWNPLYYIADDPNFRITDIQTIAQMIFPDNAKEPPIWAASSRSLFLGIVLYLIETDGLPVTLGEVLRQTTCGEDDRFSQIIEERKESDAPLSGECVAALNDYLKTSEATRTSIRKTFTSALELWFNPVIDAATAGNDFDLRRLREDRISIYVGIAPGSLDRLGKLLNLFFQQIMDLNTRQLSYKHQCLLLMDEFAALGKMQVLSKGLTFIAGYGLRLMPIIQSPAQIREIYGQEAAETFMENHALRILFAPKSNKDADDISKYLGDTTVSNRTKSRQLSGKVSKSESTSDHRRALLLPQELRALGPKRQIIITENCPPVLCRKIRYYEEKRFTERLLTPPALKDLEVKKNNFPEFQGNSSVPVVSERTVTPEDIAKMDDIDLENFSCDFSSVVIPQNDNISESEMDSIVDQFFDGLGASPA